ncbi:TetR/AcrR family transcriptional regulator [Brucella pituitosa]|uniref:TetR/AcrR family transcriptional regulator n=1 Tax=Brucella pituitosa TaxID=571256 RepID=UPI003F4AF0D0
MTTSKSVKMKKKPGRPEGNTTSKEDILDAAEVIFSEFGFSGATLRHVAEKIGVTNALIGYYFKNKENLFREVFLRKGTEIATARAKGLEQLKAGNNVPSVENLVRSFLEPSIRLRESAQGRAFLRLHSRLHMEPEALAFELRSQVYDTTTRAYAKAFLAALPHLDAESVYVRMSLMIGSYLYTFSDTNRLDELVPQKSKRNNINLDIEEIVAYVSAGMQASK